MLNGSISFVLPILRRSQELQDDFQAQQWYFKKRKDREKHPTKLFRLQIMPRYDFSAEAFPDKYKVSVDPD